MIIGHTFDILPSDISKVFKREFGYLSTFSFAVSISGLFSTVTTTFSYPLYAGGSASAVVCNTFVKRLEAIPST